MIKNVCISGRMHVLYVTEEEDDDYSLLDALQAQAERIELLEEQNNALIRQERILLQLLELSSKTGRAIADSLLELKNILACEDDESTLQRLAKKIDPSQKA